jgi:hypothetical protein
MLHQGFGRQAASLQAASMHVFEALRPSTLSWLAFTYVHLGRDDIRKGTRNVRAILLRSFQVLVAAPWERGTVTLGQKLAFFATGTLCCKYEIVSVCSIRRRRDIVRKFS